MHHQQRYPVLHLALPALGSPRIKPPLAWSCIRRSSTAPEPPAKQSQLPCAGMVMKPPPNSHLVARTPIAHARKIRHPHDTPTPGRTSPPGQRPARAEGPPLSPGLQVVQASSPPPGSTSPPHPSLRPACRPTTTAPMHQHSPPVWMPRVTTPRFAERGKHGMKSSQVLARNPHLECEFCDRRHMVLAVEEIGNKRGSEMAHPAVAHAAGADPTPQWPTSGSPQAVHQALHTQGQMAPLFALAGPLLRSC